MNQEKQVRPLAGKALKMHEGIFDEGKRLTVKQWHKVLGGKSDNVVYSTLRSLRARGIFVANVKLDPEQPGVLMPLTDSRDVCRNVNERQMNRMNGIINMNLENFQEELSVYPDLGGEISNALEATLKPLVQAKKMSLAIGPTPTKYVQRGN